MDGTEEKQLLAGKLRLTLDLQQFGIAMMRQNLIRRYPDESSAEIDARLRSWLRRPPAAEHGDLAPRQSRGVDATV